MANKRLLLEPGFTYQIEEQIHRDCRGHQAHLDIREHLDPGVTIHVDFEVSTDDGQTWSYGGGFTSIGGPQFDKDDHARRMNYCVAVFGHEPHPQTPPAPHRRVRGTLRVTGGTVRAHLHHGGISGISVDKSQFPDDWIA